MRQVFNYLTRGDWGVIGILLIFAGIGFGLNLKRDISTSELVVVEHNNKVIYKLPLNQNRSIAVSGDVGGLVLQIKNKKVWVSQSHCAQKICMHMGKISHPGQIIVCVPNRIVIQITGEDKFNFDVITQ